jgi:colanic acid/amylovoran biosynthesis glycosyltransferase
MKRLLFFTASYPYGIGENWKRDELQVLSGYYSSIEIFPFTYAGNRKPKPLPQNVSAHQPVLERNDGVREHLGLIFTGGRLGYYLKEFFRSRVYLKRSWLVNWLVASIQTEVLCRSRQFQHILSVEDKSTVLYFYWSREWAYVIPFLKKEGFAKIFVRFHGYDLYEERQSNHGYIPYRSPVLNNIHTAILLSESARKYLIQHYPYMEPNCRIFPLGTMEKGMAKPSMDGTFRIISCSGVVKVKRLELLCEALNFSDIPIVWTHIGSGNLMEKLKNQIKTLTSNIRVQLMGSLPPDEVLEFYRDRELDLFINVSESEGMPVAIMEAFSAGIPAIATDVGGTSELVTPDTGILLPENPGPEEVWKAIRTFIDFPFERKLQMRASAYHHYQMNFSSTVNAGKLLQYFIQAE